MVHYLTHQCVERAKALLEDSKQESLRYASLELRMGIEYLFYEILPLYSEELPDDITSKWQPQKIIDAILECDPDADKDSRMILSPHRTTEDGLKRSAIQFQQKAPTKKLLRKYYHRLGFYLHSPIDLQQPDESKWRADLDKTIEALTEYKTSQIISNIRVLVEIECSYCGREIKRNKKGVEESGEMRCLDPKCGAIYDVSVDGDKVHWQAKQGHYDCPYCKERNYFSIGHLQDGFNVECVKCSKKIVAKSSFILHPADGEPVKDTTSEER